MGLKTILQTAYRALRNPEEFEWSVQGFGMLRAYLDAEQKYRIHVWSALLRRPGMTESCSDIHTHPWHFASKVLWGAHLNIRYAWEPNDAGIFCRQLMVPGPGAHMLQSPKRGHLYEIGHDALVAGDSYAQKFDEIHRAIFFDGSATVITRIRGDLPDEAYTFFREASPWVSAEPESCSTRDAAEIIESACEKWNVNLAGLGE